MSADDAIQLVTFRVAGQVFGLNIFDVERILRYEQPAPLPQAPDFLEGMLAYDGASIPVVDLRRRLAVEAAIGDETRTVVLHWEQGKIGIVVDAVERLLRVPVEAVTTPTKLVRGLAAKYISGIYTHEKQTVIILAVAKLLSSKEKIALKPLTAKAAHGT